MGSTSYFYIQTGLFGRDHLVHGQDGIQQTNGVCTYFAHPTALVSVGHNYVVHSKDTRSQGYNYKLRYHLGHEDNVYGSGVRALKGRTIYSNKTNYQVATHVLLFGLGVIYARFFSGYFLGTLYYHVRDFILRGLTGASYMFL